MFDVTGIWVMNIQPLATVKAQFSKFVDEVEGTHERVVITRNGTPAVVLISVDELESIEETLDILRDPRALAEIRRGQEDIRQGRGVPLEDVTAELAERRRSEQ